jgi:hypothetical protein
MDQNDFNIEVSKSLGRIETKIDIIVSPFGPIKVIEDKIKALESDKTRNWWFTIVFAPILTAITATLRHFGIHI